MCGLLWVLRHWRLGRNFCLPSLLRRELTPPPSICDWEFDVAEVGDYAFLDASQLTSVTLGNSLRSIGEAAFQQTAITSITIPDSVTEVRGYAFGANVDVTCSSPSTCGDCSGYCD